MIKKLFRSIWGWLKTPSAKTPLGVLLFGGMAIGVVGWLGFNGVLSMTNTTEFCISCHEMQWPYEEYQQSVHYANRSGVRAGCADCHVPRADSISGWFAKIYAKIYAAKDTWHHILGTYATRELYEAGRWDMANAVWAKMRASGSRECMNCHDFEAMDPEEQDRSAQRRHAKAQRQGQTCIECHTGIAHEEPEEPDEPEEEQAPNG